MLSEALCVEGSSRERTLETAMQEHEIRSRDGWGAAECLAIINEVAQKQGGG